MRRVLPAMALCGLIVSLGCNMELAKKEGEERRSAGGSGIAGMAGGDLLNSPTSTATQPESTPEQPATDAPAPAEPPAAPQTVANSVDPTQPAVSAPSSDPGLEQVDATRKTVKQGQYKESGMIVTPIKAYFQTKARTELEIKVPHALNLYKAEHGHFPKTLEDFMRDIIEFNQVKLPELPAGHRYVYEPKTGELMVERPAK